jgi:hypothetical protein
MKPRIFAGPAVENSLPDRPFGPWFSLSRCQGVFRMKNTICFLLALFFLPGLASCTNQAAAPSLSVIAASGLNLRAAADAKAAVVVLLPYGTALELVKRTGKQAVVDNFTGEWIEVKAAGKQGFLFDAWVIPFPAPLLTGPEPERGHFRRYFQEQIGLVSEKKENEVRTLRTYKLGISEDESDIVEASSYGTKIRLPGTTVAQAYALARVLLAADDWWTLPNQPLPSANRKYRETYRMRDGQVANLEVEVTVTNGGFTILKDWEGILRALTITPDGDAAIIDMGSAH